MSFTLDKLSRVLFLGILCWHVALLPYLTGLLAFWKSFFTLWIGASLFYLVRAFQKIDVSNKAVLITGCDSGFGHALALHLDKLGFRVFATCLFADKNGEGVQGLRKKGSKKLHIIQLNVTDEEAILEARKTVESLLPAGECLWGIVNNAGTSTFGELEWIPMSMFRKQADVNLFAVIAVTKAFLPLIRKAKGRVVNVASMLGRMGIPMRSSYCLTKYAVEGLSDSLRHEMRPWGVDVSIMEPSNFVAGTSLYTVDTVTRLGNEMWKGMTDEAKKDYGKEAFDFRVEEMKTFITGGVSDITPVIQDFELALTQKYPQPRYETMTLYYKTRVFVSTHLPEWLHDIIYMG